MTTKKRPKVEKLFTEVELELMNVIWSLGECTIKDVQDALSDNRNLAYTSVATVMKILEQKNALKSQKKDKAHTYEPLIAKSDYETMTLGHLKTNVFGGNPTSMVMKLLDDADLSQDEMARIRTFIDERLKG